MSKATALRVVYFLVFCCTGAWLPKLYDYCLHKGLTETQSALILSITPIMMFVVQPLYGFLADKLGYKKTLLLSTLFASISYLGYLTKGARAAGGRDLGTAFRGRNGQPRPAGADAIGCGRAGARGRVRAA